MGAIKAYVEGLEGYAGEYFQILLRSLRPEMETGGRVFHMSEGEVLLRAQEEATYIYLLLAGRVSGVDEMESGSVYAFAHFTAPAIFGEYEVFSDCPVYRGTLVCAGDCVLASLPRSTYLEWVRGDVDALFSRTCQMVRQLVDQTGTERSYLFLSGVERMSIYLCRAWEKSGENGLLHLNVARQQMADETGLSIKTVQRALLRFRKENLISCQGRAIKVNEKQYQGLRLLCREVLP